jgi:ABC-type Zn uptake system ZnuABC Zn-binding protein ZnuA
MVKQKAIRCILAAGAFLLLAGCAQSGESQKVDERQTGDRLQVVASTTIVADVVHNVAGELVDLQVLVPAGVDEHSFQYTPEDVARVADADLVFINGAGLEAFMTPLMENSGQGARLVSLSDNIALLQASELDAHDEIVEPVTDDENSNRQGDPHVWTDPKNVALWTQTIAAALSELDSPNADQYQANAARYQQSLQELDAWIEKQVVQIPAANRLLISDHQLFTYFAERYAFQQAGIIPNYSTAAEAAAQELAALEDTIRQLSVKAIFVGNTVNPNLAQRVAADTGADLVTIYTGSLSEGEPAGTYLDYMRYNVQAIVQALK